TWKIEREGPFEPTGDLAPRVRLFEVVHPPGVPGRLILRFKARTETVNPAHLEMRTQWFGDHSQMAKSTTIKGSTNWTSYEVALDISPPTNEEKVTIAVELFVRNDQVVKATIWLKDVELIKLLPEAARPARPKNNPPATETVLKKFDPKIDKPFQSDVA